MDTDYPIPFDEGMIADTFPIAIGAAAQFKAALQLEIWGVKPKMVQQEMTLAWIELVLATLIISYVSLRFFCSFVLRIKRYDQLMSQACKY